MDNTATVSINGQPVTIEVNIISSVAPSQKGPGRDDIDGVIIDEHYCTAPLKRASNDEWTSADLRSLRAGTYIQSKTGDSFLKAGEGFNHNWIDNGGNVLSSAEVSFIIRKAFDLRKDIYFVTFSTDKSTSAAKFPSSSPRRASYLSDL